MHIRLSRFIFAGMLLAALPLTAQIHHPRHSHNPNSPSNDPQLLLPPDQAQWCFAPQSGLMGYEQYQTFDTYPQPASKGYLCIAVPPGRTFVIDHLFAEADYDQPLPFPAEWYLDTVVGGYEAMTGFAANRVGSATPNPRYVLSESVHIPVAGGTRVTLIMHSYFVSASSAIVETPGTASLLLTGHWE
jgi:hypothetical protein